MCVWFYFSFVCLHVCAYASKFKVLPAGVPPSQALPGFLITALPSVCDPAVLDVLAVWNKTQQKKDGDEPVVGSQEEIRGPSGCTPLEGKMF